MIQRVSWKHFVGQGEPFRRDDQRDDDLHAVAAFVPGVTVFSLIIIRKRRIAFKVCAGQIVQQNFVVCVEQITPEGRQVVEERCFVFQQPVVAAIQRILGD